MSTQITPDTSEELRERFGRLRWQAPDRDLLRSFFDGDPNKTESQFELLYYLTKLVERADLWSYLAPRQAGDARSHSEFEFDPNELRVRIKDTSLTYRLHGSGYRWYESGNGYVSRDYVEKLLSAWPGYVDALEDLWDEVQATLRKVEENGKKRWEAQNEEWNWRFNQLKEIAERDLVAARREAALGRHAALERWRKDAPLRADRPVALAEISGIKQLAQVQLPCYVYFLLDKGEVVYVGHTSQEIGRAIEPLAADPSKTFDDVWFLEVDWQSAKQVADSYREAFNPRYQQKKKRKG